MVFDRKWVYIYLCIYIFVCVYTYLHIVILHEIAAHRTDQVFSTMGCMWKCKIKKKKKKGLAVT